MNFKHCYFLSMYKFDVFICVGCGKLVKVVYPYYPFTGIYKHSPRCTCTKEEYKDLTYLPIIWHGAN